MTSASDFITAWTWTNSSACNFFKTPASKLRMDKFPPTVPPVSLDWLPGEQGPITTPGLRSAVELRAGDLCPACQKAHLDYDGLLNLSCLGCGYTVAGGFT